MNEIVPVIIQADALRPLIDRAANTLASAASAAEVLDAEHHADFAYDAAKAAARFALAKGAHDEVMEIIYRNQADAAEITFMAKRKLADEFDAAQARGEVAGHGGKRGNQHANVQDDNVATPTSADLGLTRPQIHEARQIRDALEAQPDLLRTVLNDMLQSGEEPTKAKLRNAIAPVVTQLRAEATEAKKVRRNEREITLAGKIRALPQKKFGVIWADPEWRFEPFSRETGMDRAPDNHYPTSETDDICTRDVGSIAADDCVLFLWATAPMLLDALRVLAAWGFEYKTHMIWAKERMGDGRGTGYWFLGEHELLLVGTRGDVPCPAMGTQWRSVISARVGEHSEKPEVFLEMVEDYFPNVPKIELNRRGAARPGWDCWGLEAVIDDDACVEGGENRSGESILDEGGLRATPPEGALEADLVALYKRASDWMSGERLAGNSPNIAALKAKLDLDYDTACTLFDAVIDGKPPNAASAKRKRVKADTVAIISAMTAEKVDYLKSQAVEANQPPADPVRDAVIAAGLVPNGYILELNRGLSFDGPLNLPSRLFRHPVEFMDAKRTGGESRLLLRHPQLRDYPPVADFLDDIEAKTGIRAEWQAQDEFGRDFGASYRWFHAVDLCTDAHWKDLLETVQFTDPDCIFGAVRHGLEFKSLALKNARSIMAHLATEEPADRSAGALAGKGLSPSRDGSKKLVSPNISLKGEAGAWLAIHGMEDGLLAYVGKFLSVTPAGMERREKCKPVEEEPLLIAEPAPIPAPTEAELVEYKMLGAIEAGIVVGGDMFDDFVARGLVFTADKIELSFLGQERSAQLERMVKAHSDGDAVRCRPAESEVA